LLTFLSIFYGFTSSKSPDFLAKVRDYFEKEKKTIRSKLKKFANGKTNDKKLP
jgi:hypothetical protein